MKKRLFALFAACVMALTMTVTAGAAEDTVSTTVTDMSLVDNRGGNYVKGNGANHSPARSFLYANEEGGVTLVQYQGDGKTITVADFDKELNFLRTRKVELGAMYGYYNLNEWGGFYAGEDYNYVIYVTPDTLNEDMIRVDQYDKQWNQLKGERFSSPYYYRDLIANDLDVTMCGDTLVIVTNYTIKSSDQTQNGHMANCRLQLNAETLSGGFSHIGVNSFVGYCSHSFVPEVAANDGYIYTFDRSDSYPGAGLFMSVFSGNLYSAAYSYPRSVFSYGRTDWGSQGNAIAAGGGVLTALSYAPSSVENTATNAYLYFNKHGVGESKTQITTGGGVGTPYVAAVNENTGFVLWNPDLYSRDEEEDNLYYAAYAINGTTPVVGRVNMVPGHYLSDCEPIAFDGGIIWYTVESGEVVFHQIKPNSAPTTTRIHIPAVQTGTPPTCSVPGTTDYIACSICGEVIQQSETIPTTPHTPKDVEAIPPSCTEEGYTAGKSCAVCDTVLEGQETVAKLPHTETDLAPIPATCHEEGRTAGKQCTVCKQVTQGYEVVSTLTHVSVEVPEQSPYYGKVGYAAGTKCQLCGDRLSGGEEIPAWEFRFAGNNLSVYERQYLVWCVNTGTAPLSCIAQFVSKDGEIMGICVSQPTGDGKTQSILFPYFRNLRYVRIVAVDEYLRPVAQEKFEWTTAG